MEETIEEQKHDIALLVEHTLYNKIRALNEDDNIGDAERNRLKEEMINEFIEYCALKFEMLTKEQIRSHVQFKLNRTIENIKKLKEDDAR